MAFKNFLRSNRWKSFANAFGRHSNRVAQQDYNATIIDYIAEIEQQIRDINDRLDELSNARGVTRRRTNDQFAAYQTGRPSIKKVPHAVWDEAEEPEDDIQHDDGDIHE